MKKWLFLSALVLGIVALVAPAPNTSAAQSDLRFITLNPTAEADAAGLQSVVGSAYINVSTGYLWVSVPMANVPEGAVVEAWLVDHGTQTDANLSNANTADEVYGVMFGNDVLADALNTSPFAQSAGILAPNSAGVFEVVYQHANSNFSPYDEVFVTLESNSESPNFDPRPATVVYRGSIADAPAAGDIVLLSPDEPSYLEGVSLGLSNIATTTPLGSLTGDGEVYVGGGTARVRLNTNGVALPADAVLEAWLWDAGLSTGGPGISNAVDVDEVYGQFIGSTVDINLETTFHALSLGVLADNGDGTLSLDANFSRYRFSPYDALVITHEADGNSINGYDPRPGSAILIATFDQGQPIEAVAAATFDAPTWATIPLRNARTGEVFTLADLAQEGFTVHVEPMATWCSNCRRQQQNVREVFNTGDAGNTIFISLSVETNLTDDTLVTYAANEGFGWTFAVADELLLQELVNAFGRTITNPPSTPTFVLFPDGTHTSLRTGYASPSEIREFVRVQ